QSARKASSNGSTRSSSSVSAVGVAPGRVDSPPMSMIAAPSSSIWWAWPSARWRSAYRPPSKKESGVTLSTPMTRGQSSATRCRPQTRCRVASSGKGRRTALVSPARPRMRLGRVRRGRGVGTGVGPERGARRGAHRLRRTRRTALHDVLDLVAVERFDFEQRLGHRFDLVAVFLDELPRQRILLVDDATDLQVDLLHRRLGHVLLRRDRAAEEHLALVLGV